MPERKKRKVGLSEYIGGIIILLTAIVLLERVGWSLWLVAVFFVIIAGYLIWRRFH